MKCFIIFAIVIGVSYGQNPPPAILSYENVNNGDGSYNFGYETENGITVGEQGTVVAARSKDEPAFTSVKGFFEYLADEGQKLRVDYTAGEEGFVAKGDHLPTPPPIPEAIMKSLALIYANAEKQKRAAKQTRPKFY